MALSQSDALVLFGVTGDLAHKMTFPALYAMVKRGTLKVPVIGVAFPKWSLERLHKRVTDSFERSGGVDNKRALAPLLSLFKYGSGDYKDADTFTAIKKELGAARRRAHYLAIPPSLFETVIQGLGKAGLAHNARVIVEKPFGRDLVAVCANNLGRRTDPYPEACGSGPEDPLYDETNYYPIRPELLGTLVKLPRGSRSQRPKLFGANPGAAWESDAPMPSSPLNPPESDPTKADPHDLDIETEYSPDIPGDERNGQRA